MGDGRVHATAARIMPCPPAHSRGGSGRSPSSAWPRLRKWTWRQRFHPCSRRQVSLTKRFRQGADGGKRGSAAQPSAVRAAQQRRAGKHGCFSRRQPLARRGERRGVSTCYEYGCSRAVPWPQRDVHVTAGENSTGGQDVKRKVWYLLGYFITAKPRVQIPPPLERATGNRLCQSRAFQSAPGHADRGNDRTDDQAVVR